MFLSFIGVYEMVVFMLSLFLSFFLLHPCRVVQKVRSESLPNLLCGHRRPASLSSHVLFPFDGMSSQDVIFLPFHFSLQS